MLSEVHGQDEGVHFLRRVIEGHVTSPLLLVGQDGIGKKFSVLEAAKEAFCRGDTSDTFHARQVDLKQHPDLTLIQQENGADIKVDTIRDLIENVNRCPTYAPTRFIVIDGAEYLNAAAANAFLKTLEEPPKVVRFFLLAESANAVIPTIRSRCGLVRYRALPEAFLVERIQRSSATDFEGTKALVVSRLAEGSVGRAIGYWHSGRLGLRDQVLELLKPDLLRNPVSLFTAVDAFKADLALSLCFLEHVLHDLLMVTVDPARITNLDIVERIRALRESVGEERVLKLLRRIRKVRRYLDRGVRINLSSHVKSALLGVWN